MYKVVDAEQIPTLNLSLAPDGPDAPLLGSPPQSFDGHSCFENPCDHKSHRLLRASSPTLLVQCTSAVLRSIWSNWFCSRSSIVTGLSGSKLCVCISVQNQSLCRCRLSLR
ncbi:hypothetical protein PoB_006717300 [Plakobranchus ocellatus]|uniref:Uncharacterized protein n=1 Tax=Plakobranchus ocellatus TaxID=259542 RepID=A0AAV4D919_9GAST|nr:hypothetical protein PoB_006717300 [Plakobranchus ocellatus]